MPTYQYACKACDHRFETVQAFTEASLTECPECSGALRKLYGSVGVVFKGSGFYRNDSRAAANGKSANGDSTKSDSNGNGNGKSEAKSASNGSSNSSAGSSSSSSESSGSSSSSSSTSSSSSSGSSSGSSASSKAAS